MNFTQKIICTCAGVCVSGAFVLDCGIPVTGWTLMLLGIVGIITAPLFANLGN